MRRNRRKGSDRPEAASDLGSALREHVFGEKPNPALLALALLQRVQSIWPDAAGSLARHSWPIKISEDGTLVVRVEKDVYAQEFSLASRRVIGRLRAALQANVVRIRLQRGPLDSVAIRSPDNDSEPEYKPEAGAAELLKGLKKNL